MKKIALASLVLGLSAVAPAAQAQCTPGSWLCADIHIGGVGGGGVVVGPPVVIAPPPPPPPRIIYVQPPPPPPRVVYVQPPPPVVVYQPAPYVTMQTQPIYRPQVRRPYYFGLQGQAGFAYLGGPMHGAMFTGGGGARIRIRDRFGVEAVANVAFGSDYNGDTRLEVPVTLSGLVYFNPEHRFQVYGLLGVGVSFAAVDYLPRNRAAHGGLAGGTYLHAGGHAGLGAEFQISQFVSLFADVRGFLRARIDDETRVNPEFTRVTSSGNVQTTNTSMGLFSQLGLAVYF